MVLFKDRVVAMGKPHYNSSIRTFRFFTWRMSTTVAMLLLLWFLLLLPHPEGMPAFSRWLSAAIPPETKSKTARTLKGCQLVLNTAHLKSR
jgi:hypothetical protein